MSFDACKVCGKWGWRDATSLPQHKCPPTWRVWSTDQGETEDDARAIYARDAEDAATDWAQRDDSESADYSIVGGSDAVVRVRGLDGSVRCFRVSGETVPQYSAKEIDGGTNGCS